MNNPAASLKCRFIGATGYPNGLEYSKQPKGREIKPIRMGFNLINSLTTENAEGKTKNGKRQKYKDG